MYSRSRFREILEGLPRGLFDRLVKQTQSDKHSKGFRCWDQLLAMIFAQLSGVKSLRELETAFNAQEPHHYHLGTRQIKRSTLSDANAKRGSEVYAELCQALLQTAQRRLRKNLGNLLYLLDSTAIDLRGRGYSEWAKPYRNNVSHGLKLHLVIEGHCHLPVHARISRAKDSDITVAREIELASGVCYAFDLGYYDFTWWYRIEACGSLFVTRLKKYTKPIVLEERPLPAASPEILEDAVIRMSRRRVGGNKLKNPYYDRPLRRIVVDRRPYKDKPLVLVSNDFESPAQEIAQRYKQRWGIELYFKWIKQNLKIKRFLGCSENAVRTQIFTALISYLLLQQYHEKQGKRVSLKLSLSSWRLNLFQRPRTEQEVARRRRRRKEYIDAIQPQLALT